VQRVRGRYLERTTGSHPKKKNAITVEDGEADLRDGLLLTHDLHGREEAKEEGGREGSERERERWAKRFPLKHTKKNTVTGTQKSVSILTFFFLFFF
jgi:hypothetical protein